MGETSNYSLEAMTREVELLMNISAAAGHRSSNRRVALNEEELKEAPAATSD